jgi:hemoglobin-like flavoprotein
MEASLIAAAESDIDIRQIVFERFFAAFPETRPSFYNLEAASGRMINETLEAMIGLADKAPWVTTTVVNFIDLHRNYAEIPFEQYADFVDMSIDALAIAAGDTWSAAAQQAWELAAERLKTLIRANF